MIFEAYHFRNQFLPCIQTYYVKDLNFTYYFLTHNVISDTYIYDSYLPPMLCIIINDAARGGAGAGAGLVRWPSSTCLVTLVMLTAATLQLNMKPHRASLCFHIDQTTSTNPCKTQETHFLSKNKLILSEDKTLKWSYLVNFSCEWNLSKHSHSTESLHLSHLILNPTYFIFILLLTICKFCIAIKQLPELLYFSND